MQPLTRRNLLQCAAGGTVALVAGCAAAATPTFAPIPTEPPPLAVTVTSEPTAASTTTSTAVDLAVKIGQLFMVGFRGLTVDDAHPIIEDIVARHLGGVVLFDYDVPHGEFVRNIASPAQLQALTQTLQGAAAIPLLIATDQEGGVVNRLHARYGFPPTLSHAALGAEDDVEATFAAAGAMARTLATMGINHNLAPVVDVNLNPANPVIAAYERSFSADPAQVIAHATAFIAAHHAQGVLCTLKHFPGHGSSRADSHRGFVDVTSTWSPLELEPYQALIDADLADSVMTAHVFNRAWDATDPATLAPAAIDGLLRTDLGYTGVVISDDLQMGAIREYYSFEEAIRKTLLAGVDIIAIANNSIYDEGVMAKGVAVVQGLIDTGEITVERIDQSYQRIMQLKARLGK